MNYLGLFGIWRELSGVISPTSWNFFGNHDNLRLFGDFAWIIWGYLGVWRGLSGVIFPTSWNFLGNHDDNNRSGDTARVRVCGVFWSYFGVFGFWFPLRSIFGLF